MIDFSILKSLKKTKQINNQYFTSGLIIGSVSFMTVNRMLILLHVLLLKLFVNQNYQKKKITMGNNKVNKTQDLTFFLGYLEDFVQKSRI